MFLSGINETDIDIKLDRMQRYPFVNSRSDFPLNARLQAHYNVKIIKEDPRGR